MKLKPKTAYPKISRNAISIDPEGGVSLKVDEAIFSLYEESKKKHGILVTYNQIELFVTNTGKDRKRILNVLIEDEKWFKKGIEFLKKHKRPYLEKQDQDTNKVEYLWETYPDIHFDNFLENYRIMPASMLVHMIHYLDTNMDYFDQVTSGGVANAAYKLRESILRFNEIHLLHERSKDLFDLLGQDLVTVDLKREEFVRTIEQIRSEKQLKPGPKTPQILIDDIEAILEDLQNSKKDVFDKGGELIISRAVNFAIEYPPFTKRWINEESAIKTYSSRRLKTLFKDVYEEMN